MKNKKQQVVVIGGGEVWDCYEDYIQFLRDLRVDLEPSTTKGWKANLQEDLGEKYQVIKISMPTPNNASYREWSIWFGKYLKVLDDQFTLVGHSLGAAFILKYISENNLGFKRIGKLILVGCPEDVDGFMRNPASNYKYSVGEIHIFHSFDDHIVPIDSAYRLSVAMPTAYTHIYKDTGHFIDEEHYPDIIKIIKQKNESDTNPVV